MESEKDKHGQPLQSFRSSMVSQRKIDELMGIIKGILADGNVDQMEAEFLLDWLNCNRDAAELWPANVIYPRIDRALADGLVDPDEQKELLTLLMSAVGGNTAHLHDEASNSTSLPITLPAPVIEFAERTFCFTGKFNSGTRAWCHQQVSIRGGVPVESITKKLHYLVIGEAGSRDWLHSTFGGKIQKAVGYAADGAGLVIVAEKHWAAHLT
jgi:NAD-dependent DNA ligase